MLGDADEAAAPRPRPEFPAHDTPDRRGRRRARDAETPRRRGVRTLKRTLAFTVWLATFAAGATGEALFVGGVLRDGDYGDAAVGIDLSERTDWQAAAFRPLVPGRYSIYVVSHDREARKEEVPFSGRLYVRVADPDGRSLLAQRYEPPALDHRLRGGMEWTRLTELRVARPSVDPWTISARTGRSDPEFAGVETSVAIVRDKDSPGISGLLNYAVVAPAAALLLLSLVAGVVLPRSGGTWMPALLSLVSLAGLAYAYAAV